MECVGQGGVGMDGAGSLGEEIKYLPSDTSLVCFYRPAFSRAP